MVGKESVGKESVDEEVRVAAIALPLPLHQLFSYRIRPEDAALAQPGMRVRVPFRRRKLIGFVVKLEAPAQCPLPLNKLKFIASVLDTLPALSPELLDLCTFAATYYAAPIGELVAGAIPSSVRKRRRPLPLSVPADVAFPEAGADELVLTDDQRQALARIARVRSANSFAVVLLHGVTGSGKTEIYLRTIARTLTEGKRALILVPEIALTPQITERIRNRFPRTALLHSMQSTRERGRNWHAIRNGKADVIVGPRSAVFAPISDLGLVVVDEEHEPSFKQDTSPRYHARDLAIVRAKRQGALVILGSATPSLESYHNAHSGRFNLAELTTRPSGAMLPKVVVVDLREEMRDRTDFPFVSRLLHKHLQEALARGEQAIVFLNRRGYATFLRCRACKDVLTCQHCDVALTYHKARNLALCHACDRNLAPPSTCALCGSGPIHYFGYGTERIVGELNARLPGARCLRLDSDATRHETTLHETLAQFGRGEADILVGTQMVARGLDFPKVSVVGIISADTSLNMPDFRAGERTFQLLCQVSGRAGRALVRGTSIIQTFAPAHPAIRLALSNSCAEFYALELADRKRSGFPPYGRLARLVVSHEQEQVAHTDARSLHDHVASVRPEDGRVMGPMPCPLSKLSNRHRYMVLIQSGTRSALNAPLAAAVALQHTLTAHVAIDVDPYSLM